VIGMSLYGSKTAGSEVRNGTLALTPEQTDLVIDMAPGQWSAFLETAAASACRRGEVLALRRSDVRNGVATISRSLAQLKDGSLLFKCPKKDKTRKVKLPQRTLAKLTEWLREQDRYRAEFGSTYASQKYAHKSDKGIVQEREPDLIFCYEDGSPHHPRAVTARMADLFVKLKLPAGANLHTLRHTHISTLLADGADLAKVSKRAGHANPGFTARVYDHVIPGDDDLADQWEKAQGGKKQGTLKIASSTSTITLKD
jgi:integrase